MLASAQDQPADAPLGLSREQFNADPGQTTPQATQFNTRKTAQHTLAACLRRRRCAA